MSGREWKPGDVARVNGSVAVRTDDNMSWWTTSGRLSDPNVAYIRPLVVIDPEDREQAERLDAAIAAAYSDAPRGVDRATPMQAALREFANPTPPRPEEPTDPSARVTDRRDNIWRLLADGDWVCTSGPDIGEYLAWSGLTGRGPLTVEVQP